MVLILGGTTEALKMADELLENGEEFVITVATEYGYQISMQKFGKKVIKIKFTEESLRRFIQEMRIKKILDCTHPYAEQITSVAEKIAKAESVEYLRHNRKIDLSAEYERRVSVESLDEAATKILELGLMRPLFTTGSKYLKFMSKLKQREVFVRVLPSEDSIRACLRAGIKPQNIIAMHGPFSVQMNLAIIHQYSIDSLVSKSSGREGGFLEKLEAARQSGIWIIVVEHKKKGVTE
jgi:precorrin-6A/cobalt-precorrin-6A reductase